MTQINFPLRPPVTKQIHHEFVMHGVTLQDDYTWLRAEGWPNKITDPEVISHLTQENEYYDYVMSPLKHEQNILFEELKSRIKLTDQSTYTTKDNYYYYTRTEADQNYPIHCRKKGSVNAPEEIILDINQLAHGHNFTAIGNIAINPTHNLLAYSVDFVGDEKYTIYVLDLSNHQLLTDVIPNTIGLIIWHENQDGFFYTPVTENWRHNTVKFHALDTNTSEDVTVFHEANELYSVSLSKSSSKNYLFINVSGHDSNEIYCLNLDAKDAHTTHTQSVPTLLEVRKEHVQYSVDHGQGYFYLHTNDNAKNFHILRIATNNISHQMHDEGNSVISEVSTDKHHWQVYLAEDRARYLSHFDLTKDYLLLNYMNYGLPELRVIDLINQKQQVLSLPDAVFDATIYSTNFTENDIRINYSSLARPSTVYFYDFISNRLQVIKQQEIPSGLNSEEYHIERVFAQNEDDNTKIPISLFYKRSLLKKDGSNPLYLYGYGSYGHRISTSFRNSAISLVNRGFVFAIAHIRGGDELGMDWYESAKFLNKKRTFSDFIAAANFLVQQEYTSKNNIAIAGGSAGGMLIGNVINQKPDLFKVAIAHVPFVDVLNTMLDATLPLTPGEYQEWGNPQDKEYFDYISSYCPYSNVTAQAYPHLFVTAGLSDPRVGYWEAAKWVAKIRQYQSNNNYTILKTNMNFGHQGASSRFDYLNEIAAELAFIMHVFGLDH